MKAELRNQMRQARSLRTTHELDFTKFLTSLTELLPKRANIASYLSYGSEPSTKGLNAHLLERGSLYLPVLKPDLDLSWRSWDGDESLLRPSPVRSRMSEPASGRVEAISNLDLILLPALAVDGEGGRLGQGGGSYDRALAGLEASKPRPMLLAIVYPEEIFQAALPMSAHDQRIDGYISENIFKRWKN